MPDHVVDRRGKDTWVERSLRFPVEELVEVCTFGTKLSYPLRCLDVSGSGMRLVGRINQLPFRLQTIVEVVFFKKVPDKELKISAKVVRITPSKDPELLAEGYFDYGVQLCFIDADELAHWHAYVKAIMATTKPLEHERPTGLR